MPGAMSSVVPVVIGVDIGGTNTDIVILSRCKGKAEVVSEVKEVTTSDVTTGVKKGVLKALLQARDKGHDVAPIQVNIGTTHFVNAVVQGKDLATVAVVRLCGPVSEELPPFCDFPPSLTEIIRGSAHLVHGGFRFDGKEHEPLDEAELRDVITNIKQQGIKNIAYIGVFSPTQPLQELRALEITNEVYPEASVSLSHEIGTIGILERENATILNETLKPLCKKTISGFKSALIDIGVTCPFFLTQNDGTIISSEGVLKHPVLTFASGPTNSMRGATFLSELKEAIVVDIGGTTTDVGVLKNGFPREASTHVKVGGVRTNFRMPDVISIGLGGGSYVSEVRNDSGALQNVTVGPLSAGLNLQNEAMVFGEDDDTKSRRLTATDVAVATGLYELGDPKKVEELDKDVAKKAVDEIHSMVEELVDKIKLSMENLPVIVVGGGSILIDRKRPMKGVSELIVPEHFGVANAIGAALSKVSANVYNVVNLFDRVDTAEMERQVTAATKAVGDDPDGKEADLATNEARRPFFSAARDDVIRELLEKVKSQAVAAGAEASSLEVLDKHDSVIPYMPGNAIQVKIKVVGDLADLSQGREENTPWQAPANTDSLLLEKSNFTVKQSVTSVGQRIDTPDQKDALDATQHPQDPHIDSDSGEWILSGWDIECIVVGAGIYGCGGGGSPHMGRLRALDCIRRGKRMRVVTPERLLRTCEPDTGVVLVPAFIGAPQIMYEQGVSSAETTRAMECLREVFEVGRYKEGNLTNTEGVQVETNNAGLTFVQNYKPPKSDLKSQQNVVGLMSAEIGGLNAIEPFLIAATLDIPVLDADGMSRAFPEVQMFIPFMYGNPGHPVGISGSGNMERSVLLHSPANKLTENFLRDVSIANGCSAGMTLSVTCGDIMQKTALHTVSAAWTLGDAILRARLNKEPVVDAILRQEAADLVITGKVTDVQRETSGGFNKGYLTVEGAGQWEGRVVRLDFQNENLVILESGRCLGSVPDLICVVDADTAEPITTEEVKYGLRVAVLLMPSHSLLRQPEALRWVGPQAFHYQDVNFEPFRQRRTTKPVPPV